MSFEDRSLRTGPTLGNGSKKNFPYDFLIYSAEEIEVVKLNNTTLAETLYSYDGGDFTVDGIGEDNGGEITLAAGVAAPTSGESILCRPKTKLRQQLVLTEGGKVPMVSLMKALDMMGFRICELWEVVGRTLVGGASTIFTGINGAIDGRALKFKDNGDGTWAIEPSAADPDEANSAVVAAEAARDAALGYASDAGDEAAAAEASRISAEAAQAAAEAAAGTFTLASQAEAEAGTDNTKYMSALRVKQAIDYQRPSNTKTVVRVVNSGSKAVNQATYTKIDTLSSETFDTNAEFASNTFTSKKTGYVRVEAQIQWGATTGGGTYTRLAIYKDGVLYRMAFGTTGTDDTTVHCLDIVQVAVGTTIEIYAYQTDSATPRNVTSAYLTIEEI